MRCWVGTSGFDEFSFVLKSDVERLRDFVSLFPAGLRAAFEFRHDSWFDDEIYTILGDAGAALVVAHAEDEGAGPELTERFVAELQALA